MGCSHIILDKNKPVKLRVFCYCCGKLVDLDNPNKGHEKCIGSTLYYGENPLSVDIEFENMRER